METSWLVVKGMHRHAQQAAQILGKKRKERKKKRKAKKRTQKERKGKERKGKERRGEERRGEERRGKATPFGVNLMRSQVLYRAA